MQKIKLGILGLGEVAQLMHLPALSELADRYEVVALHDASADLAVSIGKRWGTKNTPRTVTELVSNPEVDAVLILTPDVFHLQHTTLALQAGKHVLLEKPAALTSQDVRSLAACEAETGRKVLVGYMRSFAPVFDRAREHLKNFGQISYVRSHDLQCEGPWFYRQATRPTAPVKLDPEAIESGRAFEEQARSRVLGGALGSDSLYMAYRMLTGASIHTLSTLRALLGPPVQVKAATFGLGGKNVIAILGYQGFDCLYEVISDDNARFDAAIEIMGPSRRLRFGYNTPYIRNLPATLEYQISNTDATETHVDGPHFADPFVRELEHFYDVVVSGVAPRSSLSGAVKDLETIEMIFDKLRSEPN